MTPTTPPLDHERLRLHSLTLNQIQDVVTITDLEGRIIYVNDAACRVLGRGREELIGRSIQTYGEDARRGATQQEIMRCTLREGKWRGEVVNRRRDGSAIVLDCRTHIVRNDDGDPIGMCGVSTDITARKRAEHERDTTLELLKVLNRTSSRSGLAMEVTALMKEWSGCEAVGIRLAEGEDFPYAETSGFPARFVEAECSLCARGQRGEILRDGEGKAILECMCGAVLSGRTRPDLPFFTENGSFWTNSTSKLLAESCAEDRGGTRNRCRAEGYESVALVPLRYSGKVLGLLQFNDPEGGLFDHTRIELLERLAASLAVGLAERLSRDELQEASQRQAEAVQAGQIGLWDWDIATGEVHYSREWKAHLGYQEHEIGSDFEEWESRLHEEDREPALRAVRRFVRGDDPVFRAEFRLRHKDGSYRWILSQASRRHDPSSGRPSRVLGSHVDVTDKKVSELALRQNEALYRSLARNFPNGALLLFDHACTLLAADGHALTDGEGRRPDLVGRPLRDAFPEAWGTLGPLAAAALEGEQAGCELQMKQRVYATEVIPVPGRCAEERRGLLVIWDITRWRAQEAQLRQAQKMEAVGRLAAGVAHDFNNQLQVIIGYSELLVAGRRPDDPLAETLGEIRRAADRALVTTSHLLAFSRRQPLEPVSLEIEPLLREIAKPVGRLLGEDIAFEARAEGAVPPLFLDPSGLHQAIMNLVVNARDAMPRGGRLLLRARSLRVEPEGRDPRFPEAAPGEHGLVEVEDNGCGMDEETLEHLFEPFFTTKEKGKGTGLGLPMVQGFVAQSKGHLHVRSRPGEGTCVSLLFPRDERRPPVRAPARPLQDLPKAPRRATLLVVEDEPGVRRFVTTLLEHAGYEVVPCPDATTAIEEVKRMAPPPPLVLTDVVMPGMRGDELATTLGLQHPKMRFILMSGYSERPSRNFPLLEKPIKPRRLLETIRRELEDADEH